MQDCFCLKMLLGLCLAAGAACALAQGPAPAGRPTKLTRPADLLQAAENAIPPVAALYRAVGRPADRVQLTNGDFIDVVPVNSDVLLDPQFPGNVVAQEIEAGDKGARQVVLTRAGLGAYLPYEQLALGRLAEFERESAGLPALERLIAAERVLTAVLGFHLSMRDRPLVGTNRWADTETRLERKLLEVRRQLVREHTAAARTLDEWHQALRFADSLVETYPANTAVLTDIAHAKMRFAGFLVLHPAGKKQAARDYRTIRRQLEWIDAHFRQGPRPDALTLVADSLVQAQGPVMVLFNPEPEAIRRLLQHRAAMLLADARKMKEDQRAVPLLEAATEIWPTLPGLQDELLKRKGQYTTLLVGVRSLPKLLSPARAATDSEYQALELLFEGLVRARPHTDGRLYYSPQLWAGAQETSGGERLITLRAGARWSNGASVTGADVQKTFELLTSKRLPGHSGELADSLTMVRAAGDPSHVAVNYRQGLLDPMAPLAFKVLPRDHGGAVLPQANDEKFAQEPLGSGPYMFAGTLAEHGRTYVRFVANPYYQPGPGQHLPQIREVRLFVSADPVADFAHKVAPMHLLLDAPPASLAKLKAAGIRLAATAPERRIYFLAVNHREPLLADEKLRRALAHGIDRTRLLAEHFGGTAAFRGGALAAWGATQPIARAAMMPRVATHHQPLNGPFPAGSWAQSTDGRVPPRLSNLATAETFLKDVKASAIELELKYPDDDPRVAAACRAMAAQLDDLGTKAGKMIKLRLVGLPPHQLQKDVLARKYQLAYWHHDFPTDLYSLWPLFDPRDEALETGSNYLGYKDDGTLVELLQKAGSYRDFAEVKRLTHEIHVAVFERMPLIPLWQLDYPIAVHPQLTLPLLDPRRVFSTIDEWRLEKK